MLEVIFARLEIGTQLNFIALQVNRGFAFALFYSLMNVASLATGLLRDLFCITFARGFQVASLTSHSILTRGSRLFMFLGAPWVF